MALFFEVSAVVRTRRADMGLTQAALARLCGLSRATINQVEAASIKDLSLTRVSRLLGVLGLSMTVSAPRVRSAVDVNARSAGRSAVRAGAAGIKLPALDLAARTASVSYRRTVSAKQLREALLGGKLPRWFEPHLGTLLDEAPVTLLAAVVEQLHQEGHVDRTQIWKRMRVLAHEHQSLRDLWQ